MRRIISSTMGAGALALALVGPAAAHVHVVSNPHHDQQLAHGQNHPGFGAVQDDGLRYSCEGTLEPANSGPAGYGLETAHHGPDQGTPGKGDGCYAAPPGDPNNPTSPPTDTNPAID